MIMEVDSKCLFMDVSRCGEGAVSCKDLCRQTSEQNISQNLHGCYSILEALLLQYGKIDMKPYNVEHNHVCYNHSKLHYPSKFKNCCLCKYFRRSKPSNSGLRVITKIHAFAAWRNKDVRTSFGRQMCTQCRIDLEQSFITEKIRNECDMHFSWLYDVNVVHTPSTSTSDESHKLSQSIRDFLMEEKRERLNDFLNCKFVNEDLQVVSDVHLYV